MEGGSGASPTLTLVADQSLSFWELLSLIFRLWEEPVL